MLANRVSGCQHGSRRRRTRPPRTRRGPRSAFNRPRRASLGRPAVWPPRRRPTVAVRETLCRASSGVTRKAVRRRRSICWRICYGFPMRCAAGPLLLALCVGGCRGRAPNLETRSGEPDATVDSVTSAPSTPAAPAAPSAPAASAAPTGAETAAAPAPSNVVPAHDPSVRASTAYRCSGTEHTKRSVTLSAHEATVRIVVEGQGPCPGEVGEWHARVVPPSQRTVGRIDVNSTRGKPSRCLCRGTGTFDVSPVPPGRYRVRVSGGFQGVVAGEVECTAS
jgi:hypothetical protein